MKALVAVFPDVSGGDPPQTKKRPTLDFSKSLVSDCITPPVEREDDVVYYFAEVWGARMRVKETKASSGLPPATFSKDGYEYEILYNKYIARKGKGPSEDNSKLLCILFYHHQKTRLNVLYTYLFVSG